MSIYGTCPDQKPSASEKTKIINWIMVGKDNDYISERLPHVSKKSFSSMRRYVKNGTYDKMKARAVTMLRQGVSASEISRKIPIFNSHQIAGFARHYK